MKPLTTVQTMLRLARIRPWYFVLTHVIWTADYCLPLLTGLLIREFFDALSGSAAAHMDARTALALLVAVESTHVLSTGVGIGVWFTVWQTLKSVLRRNMYEWLLQAPGARRLPDSPGEAVSRFRDDTEMYMLYMDIWIDVIAEGVFAARRWWSCSRSTRLSRWRPVCRWCWSPPSSTRSRCASSGSAKQTGRRPRKSSPSSARSLAPSSC